MIKTGFPLTPFIHPYEKQFLYISYGYMMIFNIYKYNKKKKEKKEKNNKNHAVEIYILLYQVFFFWIFFILFFKNSKEIILSI